MKNFKTSLHVLLSFVSILGFLGGWATLAGLLSIAPQQQQPSRLRSSRPFLTTSGS